MKLFLATASAAALLLAGSPALAAQCPIKIGGLAPLSAPGAVVGGEALRDAMMIAVDDANARGGVLGCDVRLVVADTEGLPERGIAAMEKLIGADEVVAVAGGYHSSVAIAAKRIANEREVPVVFAETWNDTITSDKDLFVFRIAPLSSWNSSLVWRVALQRPDLEKVAILAENTDFGIPASQETERGLAENGVAVSTFSVDIGTQDFAPIIQRIRAERPDAIVTLTTGEMGYNFIQQAADAGIGPQDLTFIAPQEALESAAFWRNVPDGKYAFVPRVGLPETLYNDAAKAFAEQYRQVTGKRAVESFALQAYDSVGLVLAAIEKAGSTNGRDIVAALESIRYQGVLGEIYFPYGSTNDPATDGKGDEWWHQWPDVALTMIQYTEEGQSSVEAPIIYPDTYKTADPKFN